MTTRWSLMNPSYFQPSAIIKNGLKFSHFCHVRSGAILEETVVLDKDVYVEDGVQVGNISCVQNGVSIYKGVHISPWYFISPHVIFTNNISHRGEAFLPLKMANSELIRSYCWENLQPEALILTRKVLNT